MQTADSLLFNPGLPGRCKAISRCGDYSVRALLIAKHRMLVDRRPGPYYRATHSNRDWLRKAPTFYAKVGVFLLPGLAMSLQKWIVQRIIPVATTDLIRRAVAIVLAGVCAILR